MNSLERENWLRERKTYLGGSDMAAICGVPSFKKTALDVYFSKVNPEIIELTKDDPNYEAAYWGAKQEKDVAERYAEEHNVEVTIEPKLIRHPKYPFMAGNIDRWVGNYEYILECKTAHFIKSKEWGEVGTNQIPEAYLCQVAWYSAITGVPKVDIAVLIGGQDFRIYTYVQDKKFEDKLITIGKNFWLNHVQKRIPPEAMSTDDVLALYPKAKGVEVEADNEIVDKVVKLRELKNEEKTICNAVKKLQFEVQDYMKDGDILVDHSGHCLATWKNMNPRITLDAKKLQEDHKDIYQQYAKEKEGSRMFLIK
jgi:putative phage-type endonuclease